MTTMLEAMTITPELDSRCIVLDQVAMLRAHRDELARLAEQSGAASGIVQHPDWVLFELDWRGPTAAAPYIVVARNPAGRIIGYAPFLLEQHHARVALGGRHVPIYRGRTLRLLGSGVVASAHDRPLVEQAIANTLRRDRTVRVIRIQETLLPNTLATTLAAGKGGFVTIEANLLDQLNWTIQPQASVGAYLAAMDSKRRNDLTRRLRNVHKKLGEQAHLIVFDAAENVDEYCRLMNQVYARSWHADALTIDWAQPVRRQLFATLADGRQVIGHLLMLGTRPIAYVHGYRLGGRYVLDDTGYDEEFASLGIGSSLVFQAIQDIMERYPGDVIDFGYGDNQYKRVLANQQSPCGSLYIVRGGPARVRFQMIRPLRWIYRRLRRARQSGSR
jgi:CelD/BcsL family acetyltransferase involved in cellulose biosynthesis